MSWNGEPISQDKLNQMCNNTQFLYDRSPRIRYVVPGTSGTVTRDTGIKVLAGKTPFPTVTTASYLYLPIYFGTYFSSGSHPVVQATVEAANGGHRDKVMIYGLSGGEIDQTGFQAVISVDILPTLAQPGWVHWTAVGY